MKMQSLTRLFKTLSDPNRLRIMKMLQIRPLCVCEITEVLNLATSTVSRHLSLLKDAGLILDEKDGKWVNYRLNSKEAETAAQQLLALIDNNLVKDEIIERDSKVVKTIDRNVICSRF